jgi:UDPglucose 6-dehydrogenase
LTGAVRTIAPVLRSRVVIVNKSTVPIGATELVADTVRAALSPEGDTLSFSVVSNPEFLREGTAVQDSLQPERIVVGSDDEDAARSVAQLFSSTGSPVIVTDPVTAETIKYASNAFLAVKLSFVNALSQLCEAVGAQANDLMEGLGHDRRIGQGFLQPGPGWGGSCLPKDTHALLHIAESAGYDFALLRGAIEANDNQRQHVVAKVRRAARDHQTVCVLGLTFKAGTDDRRTSPAVSIAQELFDTGMVIHAFDPTLRDADADALDLRDFTLFSDPYAAATGAGVIVVLTEWDEFRGLDFAKIKELMDQPALVDARNHLDKKTLRKVGFSYEGIGSS